MFSAVAIVMANKTVLYSYGFGFPMTLTLLHIVVTWLGMWLLLSCRVYDSKPLPAGRCAMLAVTHISGIVLNNMSLHLNTVGFYQTSKVCSCIPLFLHKFSELLNRVIPVCCCRFSSRPQWH